jgi:phosphatidylglycerol:prolipoprotein diacylglycerol transferase
MWTYPKIDPVALSLGPLQIHWYGLMYLAGFTLFYLYGSYLAKKDKHWSPDLVGDFLFYVAMGVILGGRIGYILFYDLSHYINDPMDMFKVWQGGMSFHGGLVGVSLAMWYFARKTKMTLFQVSDFVAPLVPFGLFFGRLGNFINGELWGKITTSPLGMKAFDPEVGHVVNRYPTQLLEAFLEGVVLFTILAIYRRKPRTLGSITGLFLACYGLFRFLVEFYRMPDPQLGYLAFGWVTMGQILSLPMIIAGIGLMFWAAKKQPGRAVFKGQ